MVRPFRVLGVQQIAIGGEEILPRLVHNTLL